MAAMGVPPSVLDSSPEDVWTSKMAFGAWKKPGFPHPVKTCISADMSETHTSAHKKSPRRTCRGEQQERKTGGGEEGGRGVVGGGGGESVNI